MFLWCQRESFFWKEKTKVNIIGKQNCSWKFKMMRQLGAIFFFFFFDWTIVVKLFLE
jgi:hypothetical protein